MKDLKQKLANGDISAESLVDRIEEQAREIDRLKMHLVKMERGRAGREALKAQPSGVVPAWIIDALKALNGLNYTEADYAEREGVDCVFCRAEKFDAAFKPFDKIISHLSSLNQPATAGDELAAFIRDFKLDGKIYYDENTRQWLPTRDSVEGFNLAQRVTACWVGWQARASLSANHSEQVRHMVTGSCITCNGVGIVGHSILCPEAAAPSAGSQGGDV